MAIWSVKEGKIRSVLT